jgi:hypothetical protein
LRYIKQDENAMVRWNIMIHYFITWFEYNDYYEKCIKHVHVGVMKPNIKSKRCNENHRSSAAGYHPRYMSPNHHEVQKDLRLVDVRGRISILGWCGRCRRLVLLELVNLDLKVVDDVVSICERYSTVLHALLKLL